jgi:hypothetical protein
MLTGHPLLDSHLRLVLQDNTFWQAYFDQIPNKHVTFHLAILVEPYLQFILDGKKTVESRFSANRCPPYGAVKKGDIILLKRSGGPIVGLCQVADVWFYHLDPESWKFIKDKFAKAICAQGTAFWEERETASYATLMRIEQVQTIEPVNFTKRDRRGWVVLRNNPAQLEMSFEEV